jgi:hypothetical protein
MPFAVLLDSFDRYAFPAQVMFLANLVILPALAARQVARRGVATRTTDVS